LQNNSIALTFVKCHCALLYSIRWVLETLREVRRLLQQLRDGYALTHDGSQSCGIAHFVVHAAVSHSKSHGESKSTSSKAVK